MWYNRLRCNDGNFLILEDLFWRSSWMPNLIFDLLLWTTYTGASLILNFLVGPVFITWFVFQSLLVDHIWMQLLLQRIFSKVPVLMLLYLIVDRLYRCFSCCRGLFRSVQDFAYDLRSKLSFIVVFFRMVHKKNFFGRFSVKYWTFSEGPTWSKSFSLCS